LYYWDRTLRDARLSGVETRDYILKGIAAADRALTLEPDAPEAMTCKVLLLRRLAGIEDHPDTRDALLADAARLRRLAVDLQKRRIAGLKPRTDSRT
jgi:hypothetical protein